MPPTVYRIRVKGHLRSEWSAWFDGMTISHDADGNTTLTSAIIDQPALHALLVRVRDLGLTLISINQVQPGSDLVQ